MAKVQTLLNGVGVQLTERDLTWQHIMARYRLLDVATAARQAGCTEAVAAEKLNRVVEPGYVGRHPAKGSKQPKCKWPIYFHLRPNGQKALSDYGYTLPTTLYLKPGEFKPNNVPKFFGVLYFAFRHVKDGAETRKVIRQTELEELGIDWLEYPSNDRCYYVDPADCECINSLSINTTSEASTLITTCRRNFIKWRDFNGTAFAKRLARGKFRWTIVCATHGKKQELLRLAAKTGFPHPKARVPGALRVEVIDELAKLAPPLPKREVAA